MKKMDMEEEFTIMDKGWISDLVNYLAGKIDDGVRLFVQIIHLGYNTKKNETWVSHFTKPTQNDELLTHLFDCDTMGWNVKQAKSWEDHGVLIVVIELERDNT